MKKFEELNEERRDLLLNTPHQIYLVDGILKISVSGFKSYVTFGNISPSGQPQIATSLTSSTNDLYEMAKQIIDQIESKKKEIAKDHLNLSNKLK